jgi:hypothetical protein
VWNIAVSPDNNLIALLIETTNSKESLLVVLHKESGAPALEGFKFSYQRSPTMGDIKPNRIKNLHWQDATRLWIVTSYEPGAAWSLMPDSTFKSVALKVEVDVTAQTCTKVDEFASAPGEVFTASTIYKVNGVSMLVIGGAVKSSPEILKVLYHNTVTSNNQVVELDYFTAWPSLYT